MNSLESIFLLAFCLDVVGFIIRLWSSFSTYFMISRRSCSCQPPSPTYRTLRHLPTHNFHVSTLNNKGKFSESFSLFRNNYQVHSAAICSLISFVSFHYRFFIRFIAYFIVLILTPIKYLENICFCCLFLYGGLLLLFFGVGVFKFGVKNFS